MTESTPTTAVSQNSTTSHYSLQMCTIFHISVLFVSFIEPVISLFLFIPLAPLFHFYHLPHSFPDHLFLDKVQNKDVLFTLLNIIFILCLLCIIFPSSSFVFFIFFLYSTHCYSATFPYCVSTPTFSSILLSISLPSLPLLQIQFDSHSPPGLNHQDLLEGPNRGSVSPQMGFCLLTVESNDLHALCLWSVPRHLEAVEVITVICLTRQATAHSHSPPLHLLLTVMADLF